METSQAHTMLSLFITMTVFATNTYSYRLQDVLESYGAHKRNHVFNGEGRSPIFQEKRNDVESNPCMQAEKPFPCKEQQSNGPQCIPMSYVCDKNIDCYDGYDEDIEVCTAANRPSIDDIMSFLESGKDWLIPVLFEGKNIGFVAHALAVSKNLSDLKERLSLSDDAVENIHRVWGYIRDGDEEAMTELECQETHGKKFLTFSKS